MEILFCMKLYIKRNCKSIFCWKIRSHEKMLCSKVGCPEVGRETIILLWICCDMCFWCEFALFINVVGSVFFVVDLFCMNIFGGFVGDTPFQMLMPFQLQMLHRDTITDKPNLDLVQQKVLEEWLKLKGNNHFFAIERKKGKFRCSWNVNAWRWMLYQSNLFILNALDLSSVLSLSLHLFLIRLRNKAALFKLSTSSNLSLITETYA